MRKFKTWVIALGAIVLLFLIFKTLAGYVPKETNRLPYFTLISTLRMFAAYLFSLIFAISYGYLAATKKWAEKVLLPILDILQSIPILGFFPVAVGFFIALLKGERLGIEIAAIFLIFTSQAWNMAFGVYESIITIPKDLSRAVSVYDLKGWLKFKRLYFPASIPKLVYNSMMSWAGGWYFLMACEIISLGAAEYTLPGLGSFLMQSSETGRVDLILAGLFALAFIITTLYLLIFRPFSFWADKFSYQMVATGETTPKSLWLSWIKDALIFLQLGQLWNKLLLVLGKTSSFVKKHTKSQCEWFRAVTASRIFKKIGLTLLIIFAFYLIYWASHTIARVTSQPFPSEAKLIPVAILASFLRLALAYLICLSWTIPLAVLIGENERAAKLLMPIIQIIASMPATAFFPLIVIIVLSHLWGGMNTASILLIMTGMQWYILFNAIAGVQIIPADMRQSVKSFRVSGWLYWKRLLLPAIFPSLITGSITGWGGGWNALIVSEFLTFRSKTYQAFGIGSLLVKAARDGNSLMILLCLTGMTVSIVLMNRFIWRTLYEKAVVKYSIEI